MSRRHVSVLTLTTMTVGGVIGIIVSLILNVFVFDEYDAYGEVKIPGNTQLELPAGEVTVSFHSWVSGDNGLLIPQLGMSIFPPDGVAEPQVRESMGSSTTVNGDARRRVWVAQIPTAGTYNVQVEGEVNGFVNPRLAFGHGSPHWPLTWGFAGLLGAAALGWIAYLLMRSRAVRPAPPVTAQTVTSYEPTGDGIRIEQLKSLAALRDSGALTETEFEAEKRRLLDGG
ncbi:SHOCT domain-containing protein [Mycobacteroides salmoniphilum]|uniref:SHOCT domain-containing protein n=1 Tax=Mycobacteroides salmoniphilum TaxID=404941 RepID=UPI000994877B|nr:SHOCT domain-containing protein [Mycobacteroides salmoniphilum]